jgi:hypothetical protein
LASSAKIEIGEKNMGFMDHLLYVVGLLTSIGGVGAIIFGAAGILSTIWIKRQIEKERQEYRKEIENLQAINKIYAKKLDNYHVHFSETQFKLYNELWKTLLKIKVAAENVRMRLDNESLEELKPLIKEGMNFVDNNLLLIEEEHEEELVNLINDFQRIATQGTIFKHTGSSAVHANQASKSLENIEDLVKRYNERLKKIRKYLSFQIKGKNENETEKIGEKND